MQRHTGARLVGLILCPAYHLCGPGVRWEKIAAFLEAAQAHGQ